MDDPHQILQEAIREYIIKVAGERERFCEAAIQSGTYGVLETLKPDGTVTFELSDRVPYGQIHEKTEYAPPTMPTFEMVHALVKDLHEVLTKHNAVLEASASYDLSIIEVRFNGRYRTVELGCSIGDNYPDDAKLRRETENLRGL